MLLYSVSCCPFAVPTSDLPKLVLLPVAAYWRRLGVQLGVSPDQLDIIQYNNALFPDTANHCLTAVFDWWLKNSSDCTYENLAAALNVIGRRDLALTVSICNYQLKFMHIMHIC